MTKLTRTLYHYADLTPEAQAKAREWYISTDDLPFLEEDMRNYVTDQIINEGYTLENDLKVFYSLSHCQGDGASFSVNLTKDGKWYYVKQSDPHYVHENTISVTADDGEGNEIDAEAVEEQMRAIARNVAKYGYSVIKDAHSDETIAEAMEANEYTFTSTGQRIDPD